MNLQLEHCVFESGIYGFDVARIAPESPALRDPGFGLSLPSAVKLWRQDGHKFVSCRLPEETSDLLANDLAAAGFRKVEILLTFERGMNDLPADLPMPHFATTTDMPGCLALARRAFAHDRFHADRRLPAQKADELKVEWVRNALLGRADAALVERDGDDRVVGFNLLMLRAETAVIDLIAVSDEMRGRGIGQRLVRAGLQHYRDRAAIMRVGTQDENNASASLYNKCGFRPVSRAITWHWVADDLLPRATSYNS